MPETPTAQDLLEFGETLDADEADEAVAELDQQLED